MELLTELNSHIGLIHRSRHERFIQKVLIEVQDRLFTVGAILATPPEKENLENGQPLAKPWYSGIGY